MQRKTALSLRGHPSGVRGGVPAGEPFREETGCGLGKQVLVQTPQGRARLLWGGKGSASAPEPGGTFQNLGSGGAARSSRGQGLASAGPTAQAHSWGNAPCSEAASGRRWTGARHAATNEKCHFTRSLDQPRPLAFPQERPAGQVTCPPAHGPSSVTWAVDPSYLTGPRMLPGDRGCPSRAPLHPPRPSKRRCGRGSAGCGGGRTGWPRASGWPGRGSSKAGARIHWAPAPPVPANPLCPWQAV